MSMPRRTVAAVILGAWTLYAIVMAALAHYILRVSGRPMSWGRMLELQFSGAYVWAAFTPVIWWVAKRFALDCRHWYRALPIHMAACLTVSTVEQLLHQLLYPEDTPGWQVHDLAGFARLVTAMLYYTLLMYGTVVLVYYAAKYYTRYQQGRIRAGQLEAQLTQAKLQVLRMQLNPHFLFNTLHSISTLVREDPDAAETMIARLSELLRQALETAGQQLVPLHQEVEFAERYLRIEQVRFQDRLEVLFDIDPRTLDAEVPNLILQPLVENAVRHGMRDCGKLEIRSRLSGAKLLLQVIDSGRGLADGSPAGEGMGIGLANTRDRLATIYKNEHDFTLRNTSNGGIEAAIVIPFRPQGGTGVDDRSHENQDAHRG
jgi:two-component system, LytTR family, sensor kinase